MTPRAEDIESRLQALEGLVREDPALAREFLGSAPEFFHGRFDLRRYEADELARRRHLEWFLLERVSGSFQRLAIEHVAERHPARSGLASAADLAPFLNSLVGVFEITGVQPGAGMWLRDLTSAGEYPVSDPLASNVAMAGDLVAGRIFPLHDGVHSLSRAAAYYRNPALLEALRADLSRVRSTRRGVVRIRQSDLEGMFFGADMAGTPTDPVGDARGILTSAGIDNEEIDAWFEELAQTPFERERLVVGADEALGPILDRLAFETGVDIDGARRALVHAWEHLSSQGPGRGKSVRPAAKPRAPAESPEDVARALAAFEEKRKRGAPLDQVLRELEEELALDDEPAEDEDDSAPDFPGVVGAMITEFLWETETTSGPARAAEFRPLESFGRFAHKIGVFENLSLRDLTVYTTWWLPENGELESSDAARTLLSALSSFCRWADEVHETDLSKPFANTLQGLSTSLPRVVEANRRRTRTADASQGQLYEIVATSGDGATVRDRDGETHDVAVEHDLLGWLRVGDRLRAQRHPDGRLAVYCCYPPEAGALESPAR